MNEQPKYPAVKPQACATCNDTVAKSIAKPTAFAKPGTMTKSKGVRFRPLTTKNAPRRRRKRDPRIVNFY